MRTPLAHTAAAVVVLLVVSSIGAAAPRPAATSIARNTAARRAGDLARGDAARPEAARADAARADAARPGAARPDAVRPGAARPGAARGDAARADAAPAKAARVEASGEADAAAELGVAGAIRNAGDDGSQIGPRIPVVGPSIGAVLSVAYATAGLDRDPGRGWIRRARLGGLVPWVTVRTSRDTSWQDAHTEIGHGATFEVRATWRLDRLVFDSHELQVASIESARRRERRRLAVRVIHAYFAWRRAAGVVGGPDDDRVVARVAEDTAELDALTDGWFSEEVLRLERAPSETRRRSATAR